MISLAVVLALTLSQEPAPVTKTAQEKGPEAAAWAVLDDTMNSIYYSSAFA